MKTQPILISQCLQNDFVKPIDRYEPLPNLLHIGYEESHRLSGEKIDENPVTRVMNWAYHQEASNLSLIHIRDWHDESDSMQKDHLRQFGKHCIKGTAGAEFIFKEPEDSTNKPIIVDSTTLNDFIDTDLGETLRSLVKDKVRFGVIGVWTEAKVNLLCYELRSRFPDSEIAVCSALTASSSRSSHFYALDQLERLLGIKVIQSVGSFIEYLGGNANYLSRDIDHRNSDLNILATFKMDAEVERLIRYSFRDCSSVELKELSGGFSGNLVLGTESLDKEKRRQVPHVLKIGNRDEIARERMAFERVESILGNSAPRVVDFCDFGEKGAIKYRYASMGGKFSKTLQDMYCEGASISTLENILNTVFKDQLGRFYEASEREPVDLLDYYEFSSKWSGSVREKISQLINIPENSEDFNFPGGLFGNNLCRFYEEVLDTLPRNTGKSWYFSWVHGDLNGANIIVDDNSNVWLIDFFHTHKGHILKDLVKLENDILYIYTKCSNKEEFVEATRLTDLLLEVEDLSKHLPDLERRGISSPQFVKAYEIISILRRYYSLLIRTDKNPLQLMIAQLRYSVHTLGFDECDVWQRRWALYTSSGLSGLIEEKMKNLRTLVVNWLDHPLGKDVGITILPGRRDYKRNLEEDLEELKKAEITHIACLVPIDELEYYGVSNLLEQYQKNGFQVFHLPIADQHVGDVDKVDGLLDWIDETKEAGGKVLIHCAAGLGRSGMVAACYLKRKELSVFESINIVRAARTGRAIETPEQESFIQKF